SIIGTAILFAISALRRRVVLPKSGDIPVVLNIALLHMVAFTGLVSIGLQFVPAGRSVVLGYTTPLWVTIGARLFLGETLTPSRIIGLIVGLSGLRRAAHRMERSVGRIAALRRGRGDSATLLGMQTVNRSLPAITTALGLLAVPIVGVICSSLALGEPLTLALLAATALIIGGIAIGLSDPIVRLYRS